MKQQTIFTIDQKDFHVAFNDGDVFPIQSVPRPYELRWDNAEAPLSSVNLALQQNAKNLLLIDTNVLALYGDHLEVSMDRVFTVEATENFKTLDGVSRVLDFLQSHEFTKGEQLIVVGGGITQDVGAFVSAVYKRGISWLYFPTTLLSMSDSSIGGKTGINYRGAKNQLALFSAPTAVITNPIFLKTLPQEAINSGLGEVLKLCITGGPTFIDVYNQHVNQGKVLSIESYRPLITAALQVKRAIVEVDEFELNHRRSLNYGHTLGHAIEVLSDYQIPHGQAVVIGMALVNELSHQHGLLSAADLKMLNTLCYDLINASVMACLKAIHLNDIISLIQKDKKTLGQVTSFVFMRSVGDTRFVKLALDAKLLADIETALQRVLQRA